MSWLTEIAVAVISYFNITDKKITLDTFIYLWCTGSYKKSVGSSRMVIVMHGSSYIEGHELQAWDKASQGAIAVLQHRVHPG